MIKRGLFITLEGIEGVGKTTALTTLQDELMQQRVQFIMTREPGGTPIAEVLRKIILNQKFEELMTAETELLLVFAARAQHLATFVQPQLALGNWVVSDRFTDTSYAYQGGGRGLDLARIAILEQWVQGSFKPDLTLLLDAPVELAMQRIQARETWDRMEAEEHGFFERARAVYLDRAKVEPHRFVVIDASLPLDAVQQAIRHAVREKVQNEH